MLLGRLGSFFLDIITVVIFAFAIFAFVYLLILQPHKIKGSSMEPNFHDGEFLLTDKVTYRFGLPKRGDVVVFKAPPDQLEEFIKRIIGIPGDKIMIQNGEVFVNGTKLDEKYLPADFYTNSGSITPEGKTVTVPEDFYFVMGDNRNHSLDSRNIGFIQKKFITGRAWLIYWPLSKFGVVPTI